jgi:translation initiation factor 2B subunit (eIF-2B alpha/beta/delta family)
MDSTEPRVQNELKSILSDTVSGSSELLEKINAFIIGHIINRVELKNAVDIFEKQFPLFITIQKYLSRLKEMIETASFEEAIHFAVNIRNESELKFRKIYSNARPIFDKNKKIICISNSWTLQKIFKMLYDDREKLKIFILRSQPGGEGKILARSLKKFGIDIKVIEDSRMNDYVQIIDAGIIGCDVISEKGDVINKIGSKQLALECKLSNKPFYVLGDKSKIISKDEFIKHLNSTEEIPNRNLFEVIEKDLITQIITESMV